MHTFQNSHNPSLPAAFVVVIVIVACLLALFLASKQSASKTMQPIPATGLEDLSVIAPPVKAPESRGNP